MILVLAEAWYRAVRDARRTGPARGGGKVGEERGVRALPKAEGEGHFLFADGLVEETDVSVHLQKTGIASRAWSKRELGTLDAYRVIDGLRESNLFLRTAHDLLHQPA
jgi:hypothetical protein